MSEPVLVVRDVCVCGQKYSVRHARPGFAFRCPHCQRSVTLSAADMLLAKDEETVAEERAAEARVVAPLGGPSAEPALIEATLLDGEAVPMARHHSRLGYTGAVIDPSQLRADAPPDWPRGDTWPSQYGAGPVQPEVPRTLREDVWACFWFSRSTRDASKVALVTLGYLVVVAMTGCFLPATSFAAAYAAGLILLACLVAYLAQFYWRVLNHAATGLTQLPWAESGWSPWDDVIMPTFRLLFITALCLFPGRILSHYGVDGRLVLAVKMFGLALWPGCVLSVGLGDSLRSLRPDVVAQVIGACGPLYVLAWPLAVAFLWTPWAHSWLPPLCGGQLPFWVEGSLELAVMAAHPYLGYTVFRLLGVLAHHNQARLPWSK